jgi:phosphate transport system protein
MRTRFHEGLNQLKDKLLSMGGMAEAAVEQAICAYRERAPGLCQKVIANEALIDIAEREIDSRALDLLAMQQPMARDLRLILAIIKSNADLERIGDQAVNMARRVVGLIELPPAELPTDIPQMAVIVCEMLRHSLEAFVTGDAALAQRVIERDEHVDRLNQEVFELVERTMETSPELTRQALRTLIIARTLGRIADHATNIAEDAIFWIRGTDVRRNFEIAV